MKTKLWLELLEYADQCFIKATGNLPNTDQIHDLWWLTHYRQSGLCASRGYGKTLLLVIIETFFALRRWRVCHLTKFIHQKTQWEVWLKKLGWHVTQWRATLGNSQIAYRIYKQGRGPRYDVLCCDEVGTVILDSERKAFFDCSPMLNGSPLGLMIWVGTQDPNSVWQLCPHQSISPFKTEYTWIVQGYERDKRTHPAFWMDQEYHCKPTPAGGRVWQVEFKSDLRSNIAKYGVDTNPKGGYYIVGSDANGNAIIGQRFETMGEIAAFIKTIKVPIEIEMNGVGYMLYNYLVEAGCDQYLVQDFCKQKQTRITQYAIKPLYTNVEAIAKDAQRQIWKDKEHIEKFDDAHWFDAWWHSQPYSNMITFSV